MTKKWSLVLSLTVLVGCGSGGPSIQVAEAPQTELEAPPTVQESEPAQMERVKVALLGLAALMSGCVRQPVAQPDAASADEPVPLETKVADQEVSDVGPYHPQAKPTSGTTETRVLADRAERAEFGLPIPEGYRDATVEFIEAGLPLVLARGELTERDLATIVIRKVPLPGGSFDEPAECEATGRGLIEGGTDDPGTGGELVSAKIIDGPVGRTCQIHLVAPQGVAILTELHRPDNTRAAPKDIWLMTCNHAEGDTGAEAACRFALAGFRFRDD